MSEKILVETSYGLLSGISENGIQYFKGIPYAKPPVGELRFKAPQKPDAWQGERDASKVGTGAPQIKGFVSMVDKMDEDCLYLNVATPCADNLKRPVMFWIHGGGYTTGSGEQSVYMNSPLPSMGDVVLVTINYRLGVLGFVDFRGVVGDNIKVDTNNGIRDMIAALQWAKDNIANFGGDPDNITIFGESAGGMAVSMLMGSPLAEGLFHKVIAQSGATHMTILPHDANRVAEAFIEAVDISKDNIQEILNLSTSEILKAQDKINTIKFDNFDREHRLPLSSFAYVPVIGDDVLPEEPLQAIRNGIAKDIPFMTGTTVDEWMFFIQLSDPGKNNLDDEGLKKVCRSRVPGKSDEAIALYQDCMPNDSAGVDIFSAIETDRFFRIPAIRVLEAQSNHQENTFSYLFSYEASLLDGKLKSCHAIEIPFVFGNTKDDFAKLFVGESEEIHELGRQCAHAWITFAKTGNPNHDNLDEWPAYCLDKRSTMELGKECKLHEDPMSKQRMFWKDLL